MTETARLLVIDGHSMAFRAFYALPVENFSTSTGQYTNAVYGFTSMLINLLRNEEPTHLGVAFDVSRRTFRTDIYEDYKGTRAKTPEEFSGQIGLIKQVLDAMGIAHAELEGFEGDDIVATWSAQADAKGWENLIVSGDRDSFQLVDDNTTVLYPKKGVSELSRMTPEAVEAKYGVSPTHYPELAALVGDTSDNLTGVPGVGPKTAAKWLAKYGDLANLLDHADEIKGKVGDSLRAHLDDVKRNRELNRELTDLKLPVDVEGLARAEINREAVHEVFDVLQFRTLRDRLFSVFPEAGETKGEEGFELEVTRPEPGRLGDWFAAHRSDDPIGVEATGHWGAGTGDIDTLAFATTSDDAACVDVPELTPDDEKALAAWLTDPQATKAMHGAKGPLLALWARQLDLAGLDSDTQLAAYLLRPDQRSYDLDDLALRHLGRELRVQDSEQVNQETLDFGSERQPAETAMLRARAIAELAGVLDGELDDTSQRGLLHSLEMPLERVLARMEQRGVAIDMDVLDQLRSEYDARVQAAEQASFAAIGTQINLGSPKQLQAVLFDQLDMPKTKRTKSGYTTDADALEKLYQKTRHPFLEHLLAYRDTIKLRQIIDTLIKSTSDDGRIHTTYVQTVAGTGRLSSTDPNLQNIPIRTPEGRRIRDAFVPGEGFEGLMSADYSQIEMRVMAAASGDKTLIHAFASGADFHSMTASHVFDVPVEQVTPAQRSSVKQMNYGLAYGLSAYGLSSRLNVSVPEARALMDQYFQTFGPVRDYLDSLVEKARKQGYTETMLGRRRYLPDLNSSNRQRRQMAERMALNAPMQGTAADIIKTAMLQVEQELSASGLRSRMLLQIHDELVLEVAAGERDRVQQIVGDKMKHAIELTVPLDVSFGYGRSWNAAAH
ncbi:DNA polymerase I [Propionibacterium freudenreichii]|uniref:DNA polymerase I n=1 Tax=Propionibacterium freudenreichii TaxID=1744 RepID=UPI0005443AC8|nr:DNA polymerase I [Propionibacterium freudenreichii]AJQ91165.1 DNA-directed DNA polymerase [Propionibacterium freudenreichii subsp. freudenreichii]MDK9341759.1 DNA polymerase I [Propionibacterium freudenreichii]CEG91871.1 Putative DNA polymerase I [Propionibacterium freudenreichii]